MWSKRREEVADLKNEGLGGFFIVAGRVQVWASSTSLTVIVGPLCNSGTCMYISHSFCHLGHHHLDRLASLSLCLKVSVF